MRDAEKKRARLLNSNRKVNVIKGESKESKKIRDANTTTLMLIVVISVRRNIFFKEPFKKHFCYLFFKVFLCVEVPLGAIVVLHVLSSSISTDFLNYEVVRAVILVVNMMISLSYPLNFGIYCGMSKQFRDTFTELFIKRVTRRNSMQMVSVCLKLADIDDMTWKNVYQWYAKWILLAQSVFHHRHDGRCFTQCKHLNLLARLLLQSSIFCWFFCIKEKAIFESFTRI